VKESERKKERERENLRRQNCAARACMYAKECVCVYARESERMSACEWNREMSKVGSTSQHGAVIK